MYIQRITTGIPNLKMFLMKGLTAEIKLYCRTKKIKATLLWQETDDTTGMKAQTRSPPRSTPPAKKCTQKPPNRKRIAKMAFLLFSF